MKLKRFVATDSAKAMRMVKDAFGPDAVILSSHSVEEGVEVVAAVDYDENVINAAQAEQAILTPTPQGESPQELEISPLDDMRAEIQTLRSMIETQLTSSPSVKSPLHQVIASKLQQQGFSPDIIPAIIKAVNPDSNQNQAWQSVYDFLAGQIQIFPGRRIEESGIYAFIGPTGVGKTTTMAKLAARFALRYGANQLGLITTDAYRIAAHEQLMTYGKILGIHVCVADDEASLTRTLQKLSDKKLILIDTAGMNPSDERVTEQMNILKQQSAISLVMVMAATNQYSVLKHMIDAYRPYNVEQSIITKLDESIEIGAAISAHLYSHVPLSYITNGQRVPEDIKLAVKDKLLTKLKAVTTIEASTNHLEAVASSLKGELYA